VDGNSLARRAFLAILGIALCSSSAAAQPTFEDQVMEIVNQERWANGQLPPLKRNNFLDSAAEMHSGNMAVRNFFAHCDPDNGTSAADRVEAAGYTGWNALAENIAAGYATPGAVMSAWMGSSGHRANILSTTTRELGIGYAFQSGDQANIRQDANGDCTPDSFNNGPYSHYWTQDFGRIATVYPVVIAREAYETTDPNVSLYLYGTGWALEMRLRNEQGAWTAWQPFAANVAWSLSAGNGVKTVNAEIRNGATVRSASDAIVLNSDATGVAEVADNSDEAGASRASVLHPSAPNPLIASTKIAYTLREPRACCSRSTIRAGAASLAS
jgi:uncharacterized protein YkwD